MDEPLQALSFKIPKELHTQLKICAIKNEKNLTEFITEILKRELHLITASSPFEREKSDD